jgi:hypothetical protein
MQKTKMKNYIIYFISLVLVSISLTSCLKETSKPPLYGWNTPNVISFQDNGGPDGSGAGYGSTTTPFPSYHFSFGLKNDTAGFDAIIIYGPLGPATKDITVSLQVDPAALDSFNNANGSDYVTPDSTIYNFPSSVVIPKGQSQVYAHITIKASPSYDFSANYALPLKITSASGGVEVSSNFGTEINAFGIRNIYDGHYKVTAISPMVDAANANLTGNYPMDVYLETAGANSVVLVDNAIGSPSHSILSGGSTSYYGSFAPVFNFDPSGNGTIISVTNYYGQPAGNGRSAEIDPSGANKMDMSTKNFDVKYWMNQPSVITPHRTSFNEHFEYLGPR